MVILVMGKIASGKSEVVKLFQDKGFHAIFADKVAATLYLSNQAGALAVRENFGSEFLKVDGSVDRLKLRELVFNDLLELERLNRIVHPLIFAEIAGMLKNLRGKNVVVELTYLPNFPFDKLIWVERVEDGIVNTLVSERGFSPDLAVKTFNILSSPAEVDFVIDNNGELSELKGKVEEIFSCF